MTPNLYEKQLYCHKMGYKCGCRIEGNRLRVLVFHEGKKIQEGDLVQFTSAPEAYAKKYEAIYNFLTQEP